MAKKTRKEKIPKGVRQEFDDIDYWDKLKKSDEMITLENGTTLPVYDYMKKFMQEAYGNGFSRKTPEDNILQTEDQKKWARRNNNNTNRDALNVSKKTDRLTNSDFLLERGQINEAEAWEDTLKVGSYDDALNHLLVITAEELGYPVDKKTKQGLLRFYFRIKKFLRYIRKDKQNERV
jgi:hypothetical protein